jgi:NADPH-dependent 2,4-dienoyl-CoA reductase/sulfur reductase-like enzyme
MAARVVVIGTGPAGVRAAEALVEAGLRPTVIDEGRRDGGQIYRRQPDGFTRSYETLYGTESARAAALHSSFDALKSRIDYLPETLVWNIAANAVHLVSGTAYRTLEFDALIICSGATDRLMPVKGWHYAGTYSLGGAQVALKSQGCSIGSRVVLMGTGPLLYLVAAQYVKAGAAVSVVFDTSTLLQRLSALKKGIALMGVLRKARVRVYRGVRPLEISGSSEHGVSHVEVALQSGMPLKVACDAVAMGYHLRPETQLADLAGCEFSFDEPTQQWLPATDEDGRSSVKGIYLAGDGARIRGADAAERSGRLAALAAMQDGGLKVEGLTVLREQLQVFSRFAAGLRAAFPWPARFASMLPDETIVCRCEAITAGELRRVVRETGAQEANRAKAFSRVGMGRCQGRFCAHAGAEVIAAAASVPLASVGRLRGQAPVKPLPVALVEEEGATE